MEVYFPEDIERLLGSASTVARMVRRNQFPAPFFVNPGIKQPRGKRWSKAVVDAWLEERAAQAQADQARNSVIGARLVQFREAKAA